MSTECWGVEGQFIVTVNYDLTIEEMVEAGKYTWGTTSILRDIRSCRWGISRSKKGSQEVTLQVVNFGQSILSERVLHELERKDMRPATLWELLALGAQHLNPPPRNFWLIALGSVGDKYYDVGHIYGPLGPYPQVARLYGYLRSDDVIRGVETDSYNSAWSHNVSFLAVRKGNQ